MHPDQKYIKALLENDHKLIDEIYKNNASSIKKYLLSRGANEEEAGDIFQEALIDTYKMAYDKNFTLTCPLNAFLLLICKRKWYNEVQKKQRQGVTNLEDGVFIDKEDEQNAEMHVRQMERESLVMRMLDKISERCKQIILASYTGISQEKLAESLGVSYGYVRKKKSICMSELIALVNQKK